MKLAPITLATLLFAAASPVWAAPTTVTLAVPGMTCPTCPLTIKKALLKEKGVEGVAVHYEKKELLCLLTMRRPHPTPL
jgi:mercuric ion binding protein